MCLRVYLGILQSTVLNCISSENCIRYTHYYCLPKKIIIIVVKHLGPAGVSLRNIHTVDIYYRIIYAYFFAKNIIVANIAICSATGFGHSKSTTATSDCSKGQEHVFVRSYSDRLLKCDLTLDMLSENEKVVHIMLYYYTFGIFCIQYTMQYFHACQKLHVTLFRCLYYCQCNNGY